MHSHDDSPQPELTGLPYQTDEVSLPALGKAGVVLVVFFFMNLALASLGYYVFVYRETVPVSHTFETTPRQPEANVPILQKDPVAEIRKFRADEYQVEHVYAHWKDGDGKEALRSPLDRALEIVKHNGLPVASHKVNPTAAQPGINSAGVAPTGIAPVGVAPATSSVSSPVLPNASIVNPPVTAPSQNPGSGVPVQ